MEILNVGIPELLFILVIMLIVLGPKDMASNTRKAARWIRKATQSEYWRMVRDTTNELRDLPNQLIREAGIEEWEEQNRKATSLKGSTHSPTPHIPPQQTILPPAQPPAAHPDPDAPAKPEEPSTGEPDTPPSTPS
jgi:Sec-independent protein translocase protein TatA